jgi:phosphate-selective porin OprO/OprP
MPPRRGLVAVALLAVLLAAGNAVAQIPPPLAPPPTPDQPVPVTPLPQIAPPGVPTATDPLTDLMRRVTFLEDELRAAKARELTKAADDAKKPTVNWMMQLQIDGVWSGQDAAVRDALGVIPDGAAFRRARVGMFGDYGPWEYRVAMDFALSGRPTFLDVFIALNDVPGLGRVRVGHFFEPLGLEQYSQNRFVTFLERSLPSEVLAPPRNLGVMANNNWAGQRGTWAAGLFRTDSDVFGDDSGTDFRSAGTGRVTYLVWYDEETQGRDLLHVGASYSARATKNDRVRFRARPEIRIGSTDPNIPFFADTGPIPADFYQLLNGETLWVRGPFSVQAEYQLMPVSTLDRGAVYFQSWYVLGSVFLTGENRAYRTRTGVLERIIPRRDFLRRDDCGGFAVGPGAWELAFRVSHLNLNSGGVTGGRLTDLTFGVNWYLSPYVRMTANYVRAFLTPADGRSGAADFLGIRMGYEF